MFILPVHALPMGMALLLVLALAYASKDFFYCYRVHGAERTFSDWSTDLIIFVFGECLRVLSFSMVFAAFLWSSHFACWKIEASVFSLAVGYVGVDLILYFWHRILHQTSLGWALHSVHHSSESFRISLGGRIHWLQHAFDDLVYLPLVLIGFSPLAVMALVFANRLAQFWVHTECIGALPLLDLVLNTPANHRVHHHRMNAGEHKNFGSNFMLWDRLFGTYQKETARHRNYGVYEQPTQRRLPLILRPLDVQSIGLRIWAREHDNLLNRLEIAWMQVFFFVWISTYASHFGPCIFLWVCSIANLAAWMGAWVASIKTSRLLLSSALLSILAVDSIYGLDLLRAILLGPEHAVFSQSIFNEGLSWTVRALPLYHLWLPFWLCARLRRQSRSVFYDSHALVWVVGASFLVFVTSALSNSQPAGNSHSASGDWLMNPNFVRSWCSAPCLWLGYVFFLVLPAHALLQLANNPTQSLSWFAGRMDRVRTSFAKPSALVVAFAKAHALFFGGYTRRRNTAEHE